MPSTSAAGALGNGPDPPLDKPALFRSLLGSHAPTQRRRRYLHVRDMPAVQDD